MVALAFRPQRVPQNTLSLEMNVNQCPNSVHTWNARVKTKLYPELCTLQARATSLRKVTLRTRFLAESHSSWESSETSSTPPHHPCIPHPVKGLSCTVPEAFPGVPPGNKAARRWPGMGLISPSSCITFPSLLSSFLPPLHFLPFPFSLCVHRHSCVIACMYRSEDNFMCWPSPSSLLEAEFLAHQCIYQDNLPHQLLEILLSPILL